MRMKINIVSRKHLTPTERGEMYAVFVRYYENVERCRFEKDLEEKNWIIQLRNEEQQIVGFSTLQVYEHCGSLGPALVLYSGDTIIDRAYRRNGDLAGAFGHLLLRTIRENQLFPVYWLLTSKGVRTYRFLPVFFKTFFPAFNQQNGARLKVLIDEIAAAKFGADYSPQTQIVSHHGQRDWLCSAEQDPQLFQRSDPHICFFLQKNPGYPHGDELACLAEISEDNLNSRAWRVINHTEVDWRE